MKYFIGLLTILALLIVTAAWLSRDTTVYAEGYSENKFRSVRVGMPRAEVTRLIGKPMVVQEFQASGDVPHVTLYWYSLMRNVKGEYVRSIVFDDDGLVRQVNGGRLGHYLGVEGERPASLLEYLEWYVF